MPQRCIHALVSGRVQGVGYRAFIKVEADRLGIQGWIRNLPDGRVELVAQGPQEALELLEDACWAGPPLSKVIRLEGAELVSPPELTGFSIRR